MYLVIWRKLKNFAAAAHARWGRIAVRVLRWVVPILLLAILARSLTHIGWMHVWEARPRALGFYLVLFLPFFVQPLADLVIYRNLLKVGGALPLRVLLRKRYLNGVMFEYTGEAYFFLWARRHLDLHKGHLAHAVKDSNVLSAGAGLAMVWFLLLALLLGGGIKLPAFLPAHAWAFVAAGTLPLVLSLALIVGGRRVTTLSRPQIAMTFAVHLARSIANLFLDFALWWLSGALPSVALCVEFVALRLLITRLPLVPNKDLVFVGVGMAAAGLMDLSQPRVAAVLVITTAFSQLQDFALVGLPWIFSRIQVRRSATAS